MTRKQLSEHFRIMAYTDRGHCMRAAQIAKDLLNESVRLPDILESWLKVVDADYKVLREKGHVSKERAEAQGRLNATLLAVRMIGEERL